MTAETSNARGLVGYVDGSRLRELRDGRLNIALWAEPMGSADTPVYTIPTPPPPADAQQHGRPAAVDEAMVERATTAYLQSRGTYEGEVPVDRDDIRAALTAALAQQPAAVDGAYPTPRNRAEAVALARLALAYLGVIDAHIDSAVARCETDLAAQPQGDK